MYKFIFSNGLLEINDTNDDIYSIEIISKLDNSKLSFGTVSSVSLSLKLNNRDKRFSAYTFKNKSVDCYINNIKKYRFYVDEVTMKNGYINITAYDKIADLDKKFKGVEFPINLNNLIVAALAQANIELETSIFKNQGFIIHNADLAGLTCREVLGYCLEICGGIGMLNTDEKFVIRWFQNKDAKEIDINNFISYESDEEDVEFNNVRFSRGSATFNSNSDASTIKGTIYLSSDNPLLEHSTSNKIKSLIENLNVKHLSYFPCKMQISSIEKYSLGDCLTFNDEDGNKKTMLVSNITIKNLSSVQIESLPIDTTVSEDDDETEDTGARSSVSSSLSIKGITNRKDVQFSECNKNTKIFVSCTMTFTKINGNIIFSFNNKVIRAFTPVIGTNTFSFTIEGADQPENILIFDTLSTYSYQEYNFVYCNCIIVDYSEEDDPDYDYDGVDEIDGYEMYNIANIKLIKAMDYNAAVTIHYKQTGSDISELTINPTVSGGAPSASRTANNQSYTYNINANALYTNLIYESNGSLYNANIKTTFDNYLKNSANEFIIEPEQTDYDYKIYTRKVLSDGTKTKFYDVTGSNIHIGVSHEQILGVYIYCPKGKNPYVNIKVKTLSGLASLFEQSDDFSSLIPKQPDGYYFNNGTSNSPFSVKLTPNNTYNGILWITRTTWTESFKTTIQQINNNSSYTDKNKLVMLLSYLPNLSSIIESAGS